MCFRVMRLLGLLAVVAVLPACSMFSHPTRVIPVQTLPPVQALPKLQLVGIPLNQAMRLNHVATQQVRQIHEIGIPQGSIDPQADAINTLGAQALSLHESQTALAAAEDRVNVLDGQAVRLQDQLTAAAGTISQATAAENAAVAKYQNAWLGGKAWRLIWWIIGIGSTLLIADVLLSAFTGIGFNPLEWIVSLCHVGTAKRA